MNLADEMDADTTLFAAIEARMLASEGRDADGVQDIVVDWLRKRLEPTHAEQMEAFGEMG